MTLRLIPSTEQWQRWSLPSKLTFFGTALSAVSLLLSLVLFSWPKAESLFSGSIPALTNAEARAAIEPLIHDFQGSSDLRILSITSTVETLSAVAIQPPYREFPNVVLFAYEAAARHWRRVSEGLSIGIQSEKSSLLDIHTIGDAADVRQPEGDDAKRYMPALGSAVGVISVPYEQFIHLHPAGQDSYFLDKREYPRLATQLGEHPRPDKDGECTLFDTPELAGVSLSHSAGRFELQASTANGQHWTVTFVGLDTKGHLDQKAFRVTGPRSQPLSAEKMNSAMKFSPDAKVIATAREYEKVGHLERAGFSDIAYPADPTEYRAMNGYGLILITSLSQIPAELPPTPYLDVDGRRLALQLVAQEWSTPADDIVVRVLGNVRNDSLYLLPLDKSVLGRSVRLDFRKNRTGMKLPPIPAELPDQLKQVAGESLISGGEPDRRVVLRMMQREYPPLIRPQ